MLSRHWKGDNMRNIALVLSTVAALATTAVITSPAQARGGRNAAIGVGIAAGVLGTAAAANAYHNGYGPGYGYYGGPDRYYGGPHYYHGGYSRYDNW
jgi:hypothetical protein